MKTRNVIFPSIPPKIVGCLEVQLSQEQFGPISAFQWKRQIAFNCKSLTGSADAHTSKFPFELSLISVELRVISPKAFEMRRCSVITAGVIFQPV